MATFFSCLFIDVLSGADCGGRSDAAVRDVVIALVSEEAVNAEFGGTDIDAVVLTDGPVPLRERFRSTEFCGATTGAFGSILRSTERTKCPARSMADGGRSGWTTMVVGGAALVDGTALVGGTAALDGTAAPGGIAPVDVETPGDGAEVFGLDGDVDGVSLLSEGPRVTRDDMLNWDALAASANARTMAIDSEERLSSLRDFKSSPPGVPRR